MHFLGKRKEKKICTCMVYRCIASIVPIKICTSEKLNWMQTCILLFKYHKTNWEVDNILLGCFCNHEDKTLNARLAPTRLIVKSVPKYGSYRYLSLRFLTIHIFHAPLEHKKFKTSNIWFYVFSMDQIIECL